MYQFGRRLRRSANALKVEYAWIQTNHLKSKKRCYSSACAVFSGHPGILQISCISLADLAEGQPLIKWLHCVHLLGRIIRACVKSWSTFYLQSVFADDPRCENPDTFVEPLNGHERGRAHTCDCQFAWHLPAVCCY